MKFAVVCLFGCIAATAQTDSFFYGTTNLGGIQQGGVLYKFAPSTGTVTNIYSFTGSSGTQALSGVVDDSSGKFYGVTS